MPVWTSTILRRLRGGAAVARRRGRFLDSAGVRLRYFEYGTGEAVVLIHGFTRSAAAWTMSEFAPDLAQHYRVVAFDCRGHGRSGKPTGPAGYGARMAADVTALLDHLDIGAAHLIGHSMGGRIALRHAASRPDRVRSVSLIASGGTLTFKTGESDPMPIEQVARSLEQRRDFKPLLEAVLPQGRSVPRWKLHALSLAAGVMNNPRALAAVARGYAGLTVTDAELRTLRVPISAVIGSRDPYQSAVAALGRRVPGLTAVTVEGATHLDILERGETQRAVRQFLAGCRVPKRQVA